MSSILRWSSGHVGAGIDVGEQESENSTIEVVTPHSEMVPKGEQLQ